MRELEHKQRLRKKIYSTPALVLLLLVTLGLIRGAFSVMQKKIESQKYVMNLEAKSLELKAREQEIRENIKLLETKEGINREIKEKFSVTEAGEHVAIIVDSKDKSSEQENSETSWYKKLWTTISDLWQ